MLENNNRDSDSDLQSLSDDSYLQYNQDDDEGEDSGDVSDNECEEEDRLQGVSHDPESGAQWSSSDYDGHSDSNSSINSGDDIGSEWEEWSERSESDKQCVVEFIICK